MKKVVCLIAVLALTASVFAAEPITITASATGDLLTIGYNATGATKPVGFSFIVNCGTGNVAAVGDINKADSFFDVFIDFASDDPAAYQAGADPATGVWSAAHMLAKADAAGAATLPAAVFSISAAELANVATIPATGTICVLKISGLPATITFAEDTLRGGVVDTAGVAMAVTLPAPVDMSVTPTECLKTTAPEYANWVTFGKPDCWCFPRQCRGDFNGTKQGTYWVYSQDLTGLKDAYQKPVAQMTGNRICADFNHTAQGAYRVYSQDLTILKTYYQKAPTVATPCDLNNDGVLDAGDKFNFWTGAL